LLVYEGENHGVAEKTNQLDYHRRAAARTRPAAKDPGAAN
jgi:hypothetical protein